MPGVAPITLLPGACAGAGAVLVVVVVVGFLFSPSSSPSSSPVTLPYISLIPGNVNASLIFEVPPIKCCKLVFVDILI